MQYIVIEYFSILISRDQSVTPEIKGNLGSRERMEKMGRTARRY
jgi:hypothetical protein